MRTSLTGTPGRGRAREGNNTADREEKSQGGQQHSRQGREEGERGIEDNLRLCWWHTNGVWSLAQVKREDRPPQTSGEFGKRINLPIV